GAFDVDGAAVGLDNVLHDGEAQPRATHFAGAGAIDTVEALKDARLVFQRDADAVVGDFDGDHAVGSGGRQPDFSAVTGVFDGIVDEVEEGAVQIVGVAHDLREGVG